MSRRTWTKGDLHITYGNPTIQTFREKIIKDMDEAMYFYYDIDILDDTKILFHADAYDFPKVQNLPNYIDYLVNMKEEDMFVYEDYEDNGFHRKKLYNFMTLDDSFNMDMEYFYKIEKQIMYVKQRQDKEFKRYEEYTLTIGNCGKDRKLGGDNREPYGKEIFIKYLTKEDILRLKQTALDFCQVAIEDSNKALRKYKIKCPHCQEHQLFLDALLEEDDFGNKQFKCAKCKKEFTDDDDIDID